MCVVCVCVCVWCVVCVCVCGVCVCGVCVCGVCVVCVCVCGVCMCVWMAGRDKNSVSLFGLVSEEALNDTPTIMVTQNLLSQLYSHNSPNNHGF